MIYLLQNKIKEYANGNAPKDDRNKE